jgi:hypothetical protein
MRRGIIFILTASLLAAGGAGAAPPRKLGPAAKTPAVPKLIQSCDAHKFETVVHAVVGSERHDSKVKLCGVEGQSEAEWVGTLKDAIRKLEANKEMEPAVRDQIISAIKAEISRLSIVGTVPVPLRVGNGVPSAETPLSRDYVALPPLPTPPAEPRAESPPEPSQQRPAPTPTAPIEQNFAQLPALPTPHAAISTPVVVRPAPLAAVAPRLSFGCDTPGDLTSDSPCADFQRETVLTVHARDDVPAGTFLQFVRNDRSQAELPLDGLRRGRALRTALPAELCRGFTNGKLELRIVRGEGGSEVLATDGPYSLRC